MRRIKSLIETYKLHRKGISLHELERLRFLEEVGREAIKEKINGCKDVQVGSITINWREADYLVNYKRGK